MARLAGLVPPVAALALAASLSGCLNTTPLPLTPLQILLGGWPAKSETTTAAKRAYTIKGDTFQIPSIGLSVTRPSQAEWDFTPTASGVAMLQRRGVGGTEPRPSLQVSIVPLDDGTNVAEALVGDRVRLEQGGAGVAVSQIGVDGLLCEAWVITQPDPQTQLTSRAWRIHLITSNPAEPGSTKLSLVQALAEPNTFLGLLPTFEGVLKTLHVPGGPNPPVEGETAPKRIELVRSDQVDVPSLLLTLKPLDPRVWFTSALGSVATIEKRDTPAGALIRPTVTVTVLAVDPTKIQAALDEEKAGIEKAGPKVTTAEATLDGKKGVAWDWVVPIPGQTVGIKHHRVTIIDDKIVCLAESIADEKALEAVKTDLDGVLAAIKLSKPPAP